MTKRWQMSENCNSGYAITSYVFLDSNSKYYKLKKFEVFHFWVDYFATTDSILFLVFIFHHICTDDTYQFKLLEIKANIISFSNKRNILIFYFDAQQKTKTTRTWQY